MPDFTFRPTPNEPGPDGRDRYWVLGGRAQENRRLPVEQLSEDLPKPVVSSVDIN